MKTNKIVVISLVWPWQVGKGMHEVREGLSVCVCWLWSVWTHSSACADFKLKYIHFIHLIFLSEHTQSIQCTYLNSKMQQHAVQFIEGQRESSVSCLLCTMR